MLKFPGAGPEGGLTVSQLVATLEGKTETVHAADTAIDPVAEPLALEIVSATDCGLAAMAAGSDAGPVNDTRTAACTATPFVSVP
jgi:hypothetical protein